MLIFTTGVDCSCHRLDFVFNRVHIWGSEWGLVFSVICPYFLVFTVKLAIFLMVIVLEKKYCLVFERRPQSLFSISNVICPFKFCKKIKKISREQWAKAEMLLSLEPIVRLTRPSVLDVLKGIRLVSSGNPTKVVFAKDQLRLKLGPKAKYWC